MSIIINIWWVNNKSYAGEGEMGQAGGNMDGMY